MSDQKPLNEQEAPKAESEQGREINLERCFSCRHASQKNPEQGTLLCKMHNMFVNAAADEIPDDCKEYEK